MSNAIPPKFGKAVNSSDKAQRGSEPLGPSTPKAKVYET